MRRLRSGFTLVELVAALAVAGFAMLGGVLLLDQIGDSAQRIARDGAEAPREGNGARLLVRLLADARANEDTTKRFSGDAHTLTFWSSCDVPGGWMEPCRVTLAIDLRGDSSTVRASLSTGKHWRCARSQAPQSFDISHRRRRATRRGFEIGRPIPRCRVRLESFGCGIRW